MSISAGNAARQIRNRSESYPLPIDKIQSFFEEVTIPKDVFGGLSYERSERQSSSKRDVIIVRSKDRESDRDEMLRNLKQTGISAELGSGQSSVDPIDGNHKGRNFRIFLKPVSGGMQETTLNASITELFPCIAWEKGWSDPKSVEEFYDKIVTVDVDRLKCVGAQDREAAKETIAKAPDSSKFKTKMENAMGILKYLRIQNKIVS